MVNDLRGSAAPLVAQARSGPCNTVHSSFLALVVLCNSVLRCVVMAVSLGGRLSALRLPSKGLPLTSDTDLAHSSYSVNSCSMNKGMREKEGSLVNDELAWTRVSCMEERYTVSNASCNNCLLNIVLVLYLVLG